MSLCAIRKIADVTTYRCQEDQCLFEITKVADVLFSNTTRDVLDQRVEVLQRVLTEDRLDDVLANSLTRVLTKHVLVLSGTEARAGTGDG